MLPKRSAPALFGLILSGLMSLLVSRRGHKGGASGQAELGRAGRRKAVAGRAQAVSCFRQYR
jgi:hypothetical protein